MGKISGTLLHGIPIGSEEFVEHFVSKAKIKLNAIKLAQSLDSDAGFISKLRNLMLSLLKIVTYVIFPTLTLFFILGYFYVHFLPVIAIYMSFQFKPNRKTSVLRHDTAMVTVE